MIDVEEKHSVDIIQPATYTQIDSLWDMGTREHTLILPIMAALVSSMNGHRVSLVTCLAHTVQEKSLRWMTPPQGGHLIPPQALDMLRAELFEQTLQRLLPLMQRKWADRNRLLPAEVAWTRARYAQVLACDRQTLTELIFALDLQADPCPVGGKMTALLDVCSNLPAQIWVDADASLPDPALWPRMTEAVRAGTLMILQPGDASWRELATLAARQVTYLVRARKGMVCQVARVLRAGQEVRDAQVWVEHDGERQLVRLMEVLAPEGWHSYVTNELEERRLPAEVAASLCRRCWTMEDAFMRMKPLVGLTHFWNGTENMVRVQLWALWLLYAALIDLTDAVAQQLRQPAWAVSLEAVYQSLYYFTSSYHGGEVSDAVLYLAGNAKWLGIVKPEWRDHGLECYEEELSQAQSAPDSA